MATYSPMKAAVVQLARNCAYDFAKYNIRSNSVCPGAVETPISAVVRGGAAPRCGVAASCHKRVCCRC